MPRSQSQRPAMCPRCGSPHHWKYLSNGEEDQNSVKPAIPNITQTRQSASKPTGPRSAQIRPCWRQPAFLSAQAGRTAHYSFPIPIPGLPLRHICCAWSGRETRSLN
uniref:Uncharacterized protein n=1 Tax=Apteryx owenii TaxID=8824 RepID=A0A8B9PMZ6_APTOW